MSIIYRLILGIVVSIFLLGCSGSSPSPSGFGSKKGITYGSELKQPTNKKQPCQMVMEGYTKKGEHNSNYTVTWDGSCANGKAQGLGKLTMYSAYGSHYEIGYVVNGVSKDHFYTKNLDTKQITYGKYIRKNGKPDEVLALVANGNSNNVFMAGKRHGSKGTFHGVLIRRDGSEMHKYAGMFGENRLFWGGTDYIKNNKTYGKWIGYSTIDNYKAFSKGMYRDNKGSRYINLKGGVQQNSKVSQSDIASATQVETYAYTLANQAQNEGRLALQMKNKYDSLHRKKIKPKRKIKKTKRRAPSGTSTFQQSMKSVSF